MGLDFNETSTTTAKSESWRTPIALAAINEWHILQTDFISAYLTGNLKVHVYMEQIPELENYLKSCLDVSKGLNYTKQSVVKLNGPQCRLGQYGACWQDNIRDIMGKKGYQPLFFDSAVCCNLSAQIIVGSYINDFLLFGPGRDALQALTKALNEDVTLNDLGDANWFLGVKTQRNTFTGCVKLDQEQYLRDSLSELTVLSQKSIGTPMSVSCKVDMNGYKEKGTVTEVFEFQM